MFPRKKKNLKTEVVKKLKVTTVLLLSALCVTSCHEPGQGSDETGGTGTPPPGSTVKISEYALVCPESPTTELNSMCLSIRTAIEETTGVKVTYRDDFLLSTQKGEDMGKEILVGNTNRKESATALAKIGVWDYIICVDGDKIVIQAHSDALLRDAVDSFLIYIKENNGMIPDNYENIFKFDWESQMGTLTPSLYFDFNEVNNDRVTSKDGSVTARFYNTDITGGYSGKAPYFRFGKQSHMLMAPGAAGQRIEGKSGYSLSMWFMCSTGQGLSYRMVTLYGENGKPFLWMTFYGTKMELRVYRADGKYYDLDFAYTLDTKMPAWGIPTTTAGIWQHVTATFDFENDMVKFFVNGEEVACSGARLQGVTVEKDTFSFGYDKFPVQANYGIGDSIGGDNYRSYYGFYGSIDEYMMFDRALSVDDARALYLSYGPSETPSVTEDQEMIDLFVQKLGKGVTLKADSSNLIYNKRVVKADVNDYSVVNPVINGELMLAANLCERIFGTVENGTLTIGDKTVAGTEKDGRYYFSAKAVCDAKGWKYMDSVKDSGIFVMLASDSTLDGEADAKLLERMHEFCVVGEDEPTSNVEQTRVVIAASNTKLGDYTYSPSITKVGDVLYASRDISCKYTDVFVSTDDGKTWKPTGGRIDNMFWATIFENKGDLYLIGRISGSINGVGISKSTDGGKTWSKITETQGFLSVFGGNAPHCAPTPVLKLNGRIYRAFETTGGAGLFYVSASEKADLLNPASWTVSERFVGMSKPGGDNWPNESNVVVGPDGKLWIISRYNAFEKAIVFKTDAKGNIIPYNGTEKDSVIYFPSTESKFTCRYDEKTGYYIALTCPCTNPNDRYQRNYCGLAVSKDLINWELKEILLSDRELFNNQLSVAQHAFQYVDWIFDGDDILFVVRESTEDAKNFHDSNYLTFYRITNYAEHLQ